MSKNKNKIMPLGDRVLVKPLTEEELAGKTKSGIILPETVGKEKSEQGTVVAVGEGRRTESGDIVPMQVKEGDRVLFSKYGPDEVKMGDEEYYIMSESQILAVVQNK